jgi:hypothetical protein
MEILEAYDLIGSLRGAGCDHETVTHYVALRDTGHAPDERPARPMLIDEFWTRSMSGWTAQKARSAPTWCTTSSSRWGSPTRAHHAPGGCRGAEGVVVRAPAGVSAVDARARLWLQFDWGDGPNIAGRKTLLFCAWLAWSRFRVVVPTWDRTLPTLLGCLNTTLRAIGGASTYALTDNEKTSPSSTSPAFRSGIRTWSRQAAITG